MRNRYEKKNEKRVCNVQLHSATNNLHNLHEMENFNPRSSRARPSANLAGRGSLNFHSRPRGVLHL